MADPVRVARLALKGHRLDTMSQDSGQQCECGSDSRFPQRRLFGEDPPWQDIDEHRAQRVVAALEAAGVPSEGRHRRG